MRTLDTQNLVQTIQLARAKVMTEGDVVYVATVSGVWRLIMIPLTNQVGAAGWQPDGGDCLRSPSLNWVWDRVHTVYRWTNSWKKKSLKRR